MYVNTIFWGASTAVYAQLSGSTIQFGGGNVTVYGNFYPQVTNSYSCGQSGNIWTTIYAYNTTISTSDGTYKKNIEPLNEKLGLSFINALKPDLSSPKKAP